MLNLKDKLKKKNRSLYFSLKLYKDIIFKSALYIGICAFYRTGIDKS